MAFFYLNPSLGAEIPVFASENNGAHFDCRKREQEQLRPSVLYATLEHVYGILKNKIN